MSAADDSLATSLDGAKWGPIRYFAHNPVAANLLMLFLLVAGVASALLLRVQGYPDVDPRLVSIRVSAPGSSPQKVESDINRRIEEAIIGLPGAERVIGKAREGIGIVEVEIATFANPQEVFDDIKNAVDRLEAFPPPTAELPDIVLVRPTRDVMSLAVSSSALPEEGLRLVAERLRDDLLALPGVSLVSLAATREREIAIEVSEEELRRYGLTITGIAQQLRAASLSVTAGELRTQSGGIVLQTMSSRQLGEDFRNIPLITRVNGTIVTLGDVAEIRDGLVDEEIRAEMDGVPTVLVQVNATDDQSLREVGNAVRAALIDYPAPQDVSISIWSDQAGPFTAVLATIMQNALVGIILVFLILMVVFDLRQVTWTTFGVLLSFVGALALFEPANLTLNVITIFALFMLVGIVVDDALVVSENIAAERERGRRGIDAAIAGARGVVGPISVGVLTTLIAFIPFLFFTTGEMQLAKTIPFVVAFVLLISLVETFLILPTHLAPPRPWSLHPLSTIQARTRAWFTRMSDRVIAPTVSWAVRHIFGSITIGGVVVLTAAILVQVGMVPWIMSRTPDFVDYVQADLTLPAGTPFEVTAATAQRFAEQGYAINDQLEGTPVARVSILAGAAAPIRDDVGAHRTGGRTHQASIRLHLNERPLRQSYPSAVEAAWRQSLASVPEVESAVFLRHSYGLSADVAYSLEHDDADTLVQATAELRSFLEGIDGLYEVNDSLSPGKTQFDVTLTKTGVATGLSPTAVTQQLRAAYYGQEAQRIQRGRDEIKVMVRYPPERRRSLGDLENEQITGPAGTAAMPLAGVANIQEAREFATLMRVNGKQAAQVSARSDLINSRPTEARALVAEQALPRLLAKYPGLGVNYDLGSRQEAKALSTLGQLLPVIVILMYAVMAAFLRSYWKPLVAVAGIPMAFAGAVFAHLVLGWEFGIQSLFGAIGVSGIVVNDALVLLDRYNRIRGDSPEMPAIAAVSAAAQQRFRAVLLTTVTTAVALAPMLFERDDKLLFLVPMTVSMLGGLLLATVSTLVLLPTLVMIVEGRREKMA